MKLITAKDMDTKLIEQRVIRIVIEHLSDTIKSKLNPGSITADTTLDQLDVTSYEALSIVFEIEAEFHIKVPDSDVYKLRTVNDIVTGITRLLDEGSHKT